MLELYPVLPHACLGCPRIAVHMLEPYTALHFTAPDAGISELI